MSDNTISYEGIDEAVLVHALYHGTAPLGMGRFHNKPDVTVEEIAAAIKDEGPRIHLDYVFGRPIKTTIDTVAKTFSYRLYDRDAGQGRAQEIVDGLRAAREKKA